MKNRKETLAKAGGYYFQAIANLMRASHVFYKAGYPEDAGQTIEQIEKLVSTMPTESE